MTDDNVYVPRSTAGMTDNEVLDDTIQFTEQYLSFKIIQAATGLPSKRELAVENPYTQNIPSIGRLFELYYVVHVLSERMREDEDLVRGWMLQQHPGLGGKTPVEAVRAGNTRDVLSALGRGDREPSTPEIT